MLEVTKENIRSVLANFHLTQVWLINMLEKKGVRTDKAELSSILAGTRKGNKVDVILDASVQILQDYQSRMS